MSFGLSWFWFGGNSGENGTKLAIFVLPNTPTPKRRSLRLGGGSFA